MRVTGTDAWIWDAPFAYTARRYAKTRDASIIWEGHKAGRQIGYCHIEKLQPPGGLRSLEAPHPRLRRADPFQVTQRRGRPAQRAVPWPGPRPPPR